MLLFYIIAKCNDFSPLLKGYIKNLFFATFLFITINLNSQNIALYGYIDVYSDLDVQVLVDDEKCFIKEHEIRPIKLYKKEVTLFISPIFDLSIAPLNRTVVLSEQGDRQSVHLFVKEIFEAKKQKKLEKEKEEKEEKERLARQKEKLLLAEQKRINCPHCRGTSRIEYKEDCSLCWGTTTLMRTCTRCYGKGTIKKEIEECNRCDGNGWANSERTCSRCYGTGYVGRGNTYTCSTCSGKGSIRNRCGGCGGTGKKYEPVRIGGLVLNANINANEFKREPCPRCHRSGEESYTCTRCRGNGKERELSYRVCYHNY